MYIVMISAESAPLAQVGDVAECVAGLSRELLLLGHDVEIILPKYDCLRLERLWEVTNVLDFWAPYYDEWIHCTVEMGFVDGLKCYLIEPHSPQAFFQRGCIYGEPDDAARFAFFSCAALQFLRKARKQPDILHCHDWPTALTPVLLYEIFQSLGMNHSRVCLTLHDLADQGRAGEQVLRQAGLDPAAMMTPERLGDDAHPAQANLCKGGIVYADYVTTVSPRYAWETQHTDLGMGMQATLQRHAEKYGGLLCGLDDEVWNPQSDRFIEQSFCADTLQRKARNKSALRKRLALQEAARPIIAFAGRLDQQKGLDLIEHAARFCVANDAQFVLLGTSVDEEIENRFNDLAHEFKCNPDCHIELAENEQLTHQIFAGSDMVLLPSLYEPCGLAQLIGMRYGAVPIVHRVGGLADTVFDANYSTQGFEQKNGYVFNEYHAQDMEQALYRAIGLWRDFPDYFRQLRINGMKQDHSWNKPGLRYLDIYEHIRSKEP